MGVDYFNKRVTEVQEKLFDAEILLTGCVYDLLKTFDGCKADLYAEVPFFTGSGYETFHVENLYLENEKNSIGITGSSGRNAMWDELDLVSKEILMNELFQKYSAGIIYSGLSEKDEVH